MNEDEYQEYLNDEFERNLEAERQWMEYQTERFNQAETNYINSHIKWSNQDG
jgi:hypothetical protein